MPKHSPFHCFIQRASTAYVSSAHKSNHQTACVSARHMLPSDISNQSLIENHKYFPRSDDPRRRTASIGHRNVYGMRMRSQPKAALIYFYLKLNSCTFSSNSLLKQKLKWTIQVKVALERRWKGNRDGQTFAYEFFVPLCTVDSLTIARARDQTRSHKHFHFTYRRSSAALRFEMSMRSISEEPSPGHSFQFRPK